MITHGSDGRVAGIHIMFFVNIHLVHTQKALIVSISEPGAAPDRSEAILGIIYTALAKTDRIAGKDIQIPPAHRKVRSQFPDSQNVHPLGFLRCRTNEILVIYMLMRYIHIHFTVKLARVDRDAWFSPRAQSSKPISLWEIKWVLLR